MFNTTAIVSDDTGLVKQVHSTDKGVVLGPVLRSQDRESVVQSMCFGDTEDEVLGSSLARRPFLFAWAVAPGPFLQRSCLSSRATCGTHVSCSLSCNGLASLTLPVPGRTDV